MTKRRISRFEEAEHDERVQLRRAAERRNDPERYELVWDEWADVFGPTWQAKIEEGGS